jgi:hypothetical protein
VHVAAELLSCNCHRCLKTRYAPKTWLLAGVEVTVLAVTKQSKLTASTATLTYCSSVRMNSGGQDTSSIKATKVGPEL